MCLIPIASVCISLLVQSAYGQSNEAIADAGAAIWAADQYRWRDDGVIINTDGPNLFEYVDESRFGTPINKYYRDLLDNYNPVIGVPETCGSSCRVEEELFLLEMLRDGSPMRVAHDFLSANGLVDGDVAAFQNELRQIWFDMYTRSGGALDSSGFEHVFLGEIRANGNDVTGFHNWIQTYYLEKDGEFQLGNYQNTCPSDIMKFSLSWGNAFKSVSSMWVRSTAEVEMALYTLCFKARPNSVCTVNLDGSSVRIQTYDQQYGEKIYVGTAYPVC